MVVEPVVYNGENITSPLNKTDVKPGDPCHTLGTDTRNYVVGNDTYQAVTGPLMANSHPGSYCGQDAYQDMMPVQRNVVRRLTPLECERLQGYPDGWTDIGEWVDSKGKKHKEADSPRYKALGNSIALPFWKCLAKRISAQYDRDITMGSLFDGIGGFPFVFEQVNGKGSALWASEIEEFPIAVTKLRFGHQDNEPAGTGCGGIGGASWND